MHLVRVQLPDRPGSLGAVASAMGTCGADITAMEIVEKADGMVVDDFMLTLPPTTLADELVSVCNEMDGVKVLWVSRYPDSWGLEGDIELLERMLADPEQAAEVLTSAAPVVYHTQWAVLVDRRGPSVLLATELAPDLDAETLARFAPLDSAHSGSLATGWLPMWGHVEYLVCPVPGRRALLLGRQGGPAFLPSALRRVQYLAALS